MGKEVLQEEKGHTHERHAEHCGKPSRGPSGGSETRKGRVRLEQREAEQHKLVDESFTPEEEQNPPTKSRMWLILIALLQATLATVMSAMSITMPKKEMKSYRVRHQLIHEQETYVVDVKGTGSN
jgi:hypothetical protein